LKESQPGLVVLEGPQGSGKTMVSNYLAEKNYNRLRGIPKTKELKSNTGVVSWLQAIQILSDGLDDYNQPCVLDRSIWSLVVFNMRMNPERADEYYEIGSRLFKRRTQNNKYCLVIFEESLSSGLARIDLVKSLSINSAQDLDEEINLYRRLAVNLASDGFNVIGIDNDKTSKEELIQIVDRLFVKK